MENTYRIGPTNSVLYPSKSLAKGMKFHRNSMNNMDVDFYKFCVELEHKFRPVITRFLSSRLEYGYGGNCTCFFLEVDLTFRQIRISDKTPQKYSRKIARDFEYEINLNFVQSLFDLNYPSLSSY